MPEPRGTNDPYGLDHLPRPNLSLESTTHRADSVRRPAVNDRYWAKKSPTQVIHSENEPKAKTDMVTSTTENESKRTEKKVHRSWAFVSRKANDNFGTQETQGIAENTPAPSMNKGTLITESNLHTVSSQDSDKPTIVTNKKPYDFSFSSNSPPPLWSFQADVTSGALSRARRPINAQVETPALSNDASITTRTSSTQAPNASSSKTTSPCVSQNSVATSKCSTTKSTTSKTSSSRTSDNQSSSTTNSSRPSDNQSSSTTNSSSSSINQQSSTTNQPRSQGNRQRFSRNSSSSTSNSSSSSSNTNRRRRRQRDQSPEICWSEDVDNFMGCKSINELVKFIEG